MGPIGDPIRSRKYGSSWGQTGPFISATERCRGPSPPGETLEINTHPTPFPSNSTSLLKLLPHDLEQLFQLERFLQAVQTTLLDLVLRGIRTHEQHREPFQSFSMQVVVEFKTIHAGELIIEQKEIGANGSDSL